MTSLDLAPLQAEEMTSADPAPPAPPESAQERARRGGSAKSSAKRAAAIANGKRGGRPPKWTAARQWLLAHPQPPKNAQDWADVASSLVTSDLQDRQVHYAVARLAALALRQAAIDAKR